MALQPAHRPRRHPRLLVCAAVLALGTACSGGGGAPAAAPSTAPPANPAPAAGPRQVSTPDQIYADQGPAPAGPHGTLLRYEEVTPSIVPGARTYRVLYTSRSVSDEPIEVTGTVLVPEAPAPADGRIVLTLAHGTSGVADRCAPSKEPQRSELALMGPAISRGWLVAMSDYEGLGSPGRHPYLVGESEGRSVIDAVLAAHDLPEARPGNRALVAGYSQGGHGALWATQVARQWAPELTVLGTFAGAPATEINLILQAAPTLPNPAFIFLLAAGFQDSYPDADPAAVLSAAGMARLPVVDQGCVADVFRALADTAPGSLVKADAATAQPWAELARRNNPGQVKLDSPVLIIHSGRDETVPTVLSDILEKRMCGLGQVVERRVIANGGSHGATVGPAYADGLTWLAQRVDGMKPKNDCTAR